MFGMMGVFAEFERAMIQERVRAGLARAKAAGKTFGPPRIDSAAEKEIRQALRKANIGMRKIAVVRCGDRHCAADCARDAILRSTRARSGVNIWCGGAIHSAKTFPPLTEHVASLADTDCASSVLPVDKLLNEKVPTPAPFPKITLALQAENAGSKSIFICRAVEPW
jgi:hypothetical protein